MKFPIIKNKKWFLLVSVLFVSLSIYSLVSFGLKPGIDFKSGSMWQISVPAAERSLSDFLKSDLKIEDPIISYDAQTDSFSIVMGETTDALRAEYSEKLKSRFGDLKELDFGSTSPSVSSELRNRAVLLIVSVLAVMALYITIAFRGISKPVSSWKYGIATVIALAHDVTIAAGVYALIGHLKGVTVDTNFIVALLTIAGFSAQDTIVVFDRIRENLLGEKGKTNLPEVVNKSVNEVLGRSINTSVSIMLVLAAIAFFGPLSVKYFALTMLVGLFFGTYSSIFIASPVLVIWHSLDTKVKKL